MGQYCWRHDAQLCRKQPSYIPWYQRIRKKRIEKQRKRNKIIVRDWRQVVNIEKGSWTWRLIKCLDRFPAELHRACGSERMIGDEIRHTELREHRIERICIQNDVEMHAGQVVRRYLTKRRVHWDVLSERGVKDEGQACNVWSFEQCRLQWKGVSVPEGRGWIHVFLRSFFILFPVLLVFLTV